VEKSAEKGARGPGGAEPGVKEVDAVSVCDRQVCKDWDVQEPADCLLWSLSIG
jgi:hypothetical protein